MPVVENGSISRAVHPAMALNIIGLFEIPPHSRDLFCVPVGDMRWYLNINSRNGIIFYLLPLGKGDADKIPPSGSGTRLFRTSRKGSGRKLRSILCC
jgi:hypothetical protein